MIFIPSPQKDKNGTYLVTCAHVIEDCSKDALMVGGTPTMYFNGKIDKSKNRYKRFTFQI